MTSATDGLQHACKECHKVRSQSGYFRSLNRTIKRWLDQIDHASRQKAYRLGATSDVWLWLEVSEREFIEGLLDAQGGCCAYCGVEMTREQTAEFTQANLEHVVSQERGGLHEPGNLVWACTSCNSSKKLPIAEWLTNQANLKSKPRRPRGLSWAFAAAMSYSYLVTSRAHHEAS